MKGWVGLVSWPTADNLMVTCRLQVRCRPGKVRRSKTDFLPLSYTANWHCCTRTWCFRLSFCVLFVRVSCNIWSTVVLKESQSYSTYWSGFVVTSVGNWSRVCTKVCFKPGFHYPSWQPELTAWVDGWPVSITRQHGPCWRVMETCHLSTRVVETGL